MTVLPASSDAGPSPGAAGNAGRQLLALAGVLELERRLRRAATAEELGFLLVNELQAILRHRQAALWRRGGGGALQAVSGVAVLDRDAPYALWLRSVMRHLDGAHGDSGGVRVAAADLPPDLARDWEQWLPGHALWLPLPAGAGSAPVVLLLARETPWTDADVHLLGYPAEAGGHAWAALAGRRRDVWRASLRATRRMGVLAALALALGAAVWPVHQTALAPAEVTPRDPVVVRAPIDGVIDRVAVQPNEPVREGQLLLALDRTRLQNRLDVARKAWEVAEAELRQAAQQALFDPRGKASLAILQGRMEQQAAEVAYVEELLARVEARAPRDGIAIFGDVNDWIGRPVAIGERILTIADPRAAELEIRLPTADAIALEPGAPVRLFLNVDPQNPLDARLTFAAYRAELTPEGVLAYRLKAAFADGVPPPRIGLEGTARVQGERSTLLYALLRRPLTALRQRFGL